MDKKAQTIEAYNQNADALAKRYDENGARIDSIEEALSLVKERPMVLEIGCGNGRDAEEIYKRTNDYIGIDISEKMLVLARQRVPNGRFEVADVEGYLFPKRLDATFAFASLLHVPKEIFKKVLENVYDATSDGGVFYISVKYADEYIEKTKEDDFGIRTFYFFSKKDIEEMKGSWRVIKNEQYDLKGQMWLKVLLQKPA